MTQAAGRSVVRTGSVDGLLGGGHKAVGHRFSRAQVSFGKLRPRGIYGKQTRNHSDFTNHKKCTDSHKLPSCELASTSHEDHVGECKAGRDWIL